MKTAHKIFIIVMMIGAILATAAFIVMAVLIAATL